MTADRTVTDVTRESRAGEPSSAFLYRVLDAEAPTGPSGRYALSDVERVLLGRDQRLTTSRTTAGPSRVLQLGFPDRWMSTQHAKLTLVMARWILEDAGSKNGLRLNGELTTRAELEDGDVVELGRTFFVFRAHQPAAGDLESDALRPPHAGLATLQPQLAARFEELARIAASGVPVALSGPSGVGKEVVAQALHALSGRGGPFIAVNCGALPDELVEAELFGYRKGAFSGALDDRTGFVRAAHGGTLLLDEVGDLPLHAQPALLRVLQERVVTPLGTDLPQPVDVRVLSATQRPLASLAADGRFREDLRARLSGYELALPSLHERREDLGLISATLLARQGDKGRTVRLSVEAARAVMLSAWPLNVRELEKALEAAVVLADGRKLELAHLPEAMRAASGRPQPGSESARPLSPEDLERKQRLEAALAAHAGNVSAVARDLGKARMQIQRWLERYGLDPLAFKRAQ